MESLALTLEIDTKSQITLRLLLRNFQVLILINRSTTLMKTKRSGIRKTTQRESRRRLRSW
jgi:hypothetical protein